MFLLGLLGQRRVQLNRDLFLARGSRMLLARVLVSTARRRPIVSLLCSLLVMPLVMALALLLEARLQLFLARERFKSQTFCRANSVQLMVLVLLSLCWHFNVLLADDLRWSGVPHTGYLR